MNTFCSTPDTFFDRINRIDRIFELIHPVNPVNPVKKKCQQSHEGCRFVSPIRAWDWPVILGVSLLPRKSSLIVTLSFV